MILVTSMLPFASSLISSLKPIPKTNKLLYRRETFLGWNPFATSEFSSTPSFFKAQFVMFLSKYSSWQYSIRTAFSHSSMHRSLILPLLHSF